MCILKLRIDSNIDNFSMSSTTNDEHDKSVDLPSSQRSYAFIESDANELEQIIDLLRQFFPRTKVVESNHPNLNSQTVEQVSTPIFRGKVKDYLQRRYLEQMSAITKISRTNTASSRSSTLDMDESSNETTKEQSNDDEFTQFVIPKFQSRKRSSTSSNRTSIPPTPYSVASDPGPLRSPWLNTPTSTFHFRFPQDQVSANAQNSISQLSTLTKMLCDEPSIHTPITPRLKLDKQKDSSSLLSCQICRQEYDSQQLYLEHYRTHLETTCDEQKSDNIADTRQFSCELCSKRFSRSDMLNRHLRLHSGIRPYRCTMCTTQFSRSDHLSTHLRTHTGEKPYTCPHCSYAACRRDMITRHLKIHRKQRSERKNATSTFHSTQ